MALVMATLPLLDRLSSLDAARFEYCASTAPSVSISGHVDRRGG
jgi:hypothetical protein